MVEEQDTVMVSSEEFDWDLPVALSSEEIAEVTAEIRF